MFSPWGVLMKPPECEDKPCPIMITVLIADDEASIRTILSKAMENKGFEVIKAQNGSIAKSILQEKKIDLAIVDVRMPELTGLELLDFQDSYKGKPVFFVITAEDTMENAVQAMKKGAYDYLTKPFDLEELSLVVDRALKNRQIQEEIQVIKRVSHEPHSSKAHIVGKSKSILEVYKTIGRVADQDVTVLIEGESGTGKELVAKAIHEQGSRSPFPFVAVNCSAIPENLLESELFGYKKGAFTGAQSDKVGYFERAHLGTLFLDEIGDMPMALQAKILRVIQEKEVQRLGSTQSTPINVRLVAATNQNLETSVKNGTFREDLYFRLNVVPIYLPPLRERRDDIRPLVEFFLSKGASELKTDIDSVSDDALKYLEEQDWQGNIRELENFLRRALVLSHGKTLERKVLESLSKGRAQNQWIKRLDGSTLENVIEESIAQDFKKLSARDKNIYQKYISQMERPLLANMLHFTKGNQLKAAEVLGINRNTLRKKIRELGIKVTKEN